MAIAPSNNLLNALSQLQGAKPAGQAASTARSQATSSSAFASALSAAGGIKVSAENTKSAPHTLASQAQAPASPAPAANGARRQHLGQHVNILV